ncbi:MULTISPECIES: NAD(P)-dependent alcohol dehydrogenase [Nocardiaceae]|uniref:NAD(P)-dependent alcohol dehydrogenase n=1 Tax=Nocardiaceae TaxID=85025 RepID=UPI000567C3CB|nr:MULTISPECIES: NAD(P)-dependent alcohol dehydrogenase [Rhodococcus]OZF06292.1 NAD(P)-dependent alcohol dehydrogenase [Rhodococcus sp. 15-1189-1-1a]OZF21060.1 NAD(P)-dependent alcohol dehydrogenase [Rhodococcus sp. 14-2686-1-2]OZF57560.1 NAD(P)-dependent alcohol dehydrogenase [Rhodococcus sp. 14-2470-1b]
MTTSMSAAVSRGPNTPFALEQVDIDDPRPDEILVSIAATGLCHTDLFTKAATPAKSGPAILGHEGAGVVVEVGREIEGVAPGDHVVLTYRHCGRCDRCLRGNPAYCLRSYSLNRLGPRPDGTHVVASDGTGVNTRFFGQSSFAEYAIAYADNVVVVDHTLDLNVIAPLGCGFQTGAGAILNVLRPESDSSVVVFGAGSVGFSAMLAARSAGVQAIVAVDPHDTRRDLARSFGFEAVDSAAGNVVEQVRDFTGGGATHGLDTTGIPAVVLTALSTLRARGDLVVLGLGDRELTIDVQDLMLSGKSIRGCIEGDSVAREFIPQLANLYARGDFPVDRLTTEYPFSDLERAIADQRAGAVVKPVLVW